VGVSHGANHSESIPSLRHVQVGQQYVKFLRGDATKRFAHTRYRDYLKPVAFQCYLQHITDSIVVVG